ncbi:unnamed protein product [Scytosiphon promiscuus]
MTTMVKPMSFVESASHQNCPCLKCRRIMVARLDSAEEQLIQYVAMGDARGVKRILAAGGSADGNPEQDFQPIILAAAAGRTSVLRLLVKEGANVDATAPRDVQYAPDEQLQVARGQRAIHAAIDNIQIDCFRVLLRAGTDINAPNSLGCTPLMSACRGATIGGESAALCVEMVRVLLKEGADAEYKDIHGTTALHIAAYNGNAEVIDILLPWLPTHSLGCRTSDGMTPLYMAADNGSEAAVSRMLSAWAKQPAAYHVGCSCCGSSDELRCPLAAAVYRGEEKVVRLLLDSGMDAIGGTLAVTPPAMETALRASRTRILRMLLAVEGEERREPWARLFFQGSSMLHLAAAFGIVEAVGLLLAAGADETAVDSEGRSVSEVIGELASETYRQRNVGDGGSAEQEAAATRRLLARGAAFRARSWAWEVLGREDDGDGAAASGVDGAPPSLNVRIFRPRSRKLFSERIGRFCLK